MVYSFYLFCQFGRFPHEWLDLPQQERAAIMAMIDEKSRQDEEARRSAKR